MRAVRVFLRSPARISVFAFALVIATGALLLMLPIAAWGPGLGWVNALFTSTSATCVTGLVVVDTGTALKPFGQGVVLILIQAGGLGIMTLSTLLLLMVGRRPGLTERIVVQDTFTQSGQRSIGAVLGEVALFTAALEGAGALLLFLRFLPGAQAPEALYLAVFHSVSAFCNAGFSLFPDGFVAYAEDGFLNVVLCLLIITGGLGFLVLSELKRRFPATGRNWSRISLHSKIVLSATCMLLAGGTLVILVMEWSNTLAPLSMMGRFLAGFFQSTTARTAGFNTLAIGCMANETLLILMLLMFIGASPGSCGGGVKTTTVASVVLLGISRLRGWDRPQAFRRSLPDSSVDKAVSIVMVGFLVVILGTLALLITELGETPHALSRGKFLELLFETVSAFCTVGLSTGVTPHLTSGGKLILAAVMFVGRLGPLAVALTLGRPGVSRYHYAEEGVMVG